MKASDDTKQVLSVDEANRFAIEKLQPNRFWIFMLSIFIFAYFAPVIFWLFLKELPNRPVNSPIVDALYPISYRSMILLGSMQHWSVFSPDLNHTVYHNTAIITFNDGATKIYEIARMPKLSYWERFKHEKLRKVFGDNVLYDWDTFKQFRPAVAQYFACANSDPHNQPVMVAFEFNYNHNPPPDPKNWNYRNHLPWHTEKAVTFVYSVRQSDLHLNDTRVSGLRISDMQSDLSAQDEADK